jgi:hypothetical protein
LEVAGDVVVPVVEVISMHEQAELSLDGDAWQFARAVGKPVVAVWLVARYGVQNAEAADGLLRMALRQLSALLQRLD